MATQEINIESGKKSVVEINSLHTIAPENKRHSALRVMKLGEKYEEIFSIEADGRFLLRGKEIACDKETADVLIQSFPFTAPPKLEVTIGSES